MMIASTGSLLVVVVIVDYFEEVPAIIVALSLVALVASMILAPIEAARKEATSNPA